jgi:hypothetical protein
MPLFPSLPLALLDWCRVQSMSTLDDFCVRMDRGLALPEVLWLRYTAHPARLRGQNQLAHNLFASLLSVAVVVEVVEVTD